MNINLKDWLVGMAPAFAIWLMLPDVLTRTETAVFVVSVAWLIAVAAYDLRKRFRRLKVERERLRIRKGTDRRSGKVINFTPRGPKSMYFVTVRGEREKVVMM